MSKTPRQHIAPPKSADRFLGWFCRSELLEEVKGDLHECYYKDQTTKGSFRAWWLYWYHVLHFLRPFALKQFSNRLNHVPMLKNNIKIGFRNIIRHKGFSIIHIFGLVMGITSSLLILAYVNNENQVDQQHGNKSLVHRVDTDIEAGSTFLSISAASGALGPALRQEFPEVEDFTRLSRSWSPLLVRYENQSYFESNAVYADQSLFRLFDFELSRGSEENALDAPFKVVITQSLAQKYFGKTDPLGRFLEIKGRPYKVGGVLAKLPPSHLEFDMLISFKTWISDFPTTETNWGWSPTATYLLLSPQASRESLVARFPAFVEKHMGLADDAKKELSLSSLDKLYFEETRLGDIGKHGNKKQLYLLLSAAALIIILALSNFINLSSVRASSRMKEVGVRKVVGAHRLQLVNQFFVETFIITFLAIVLSAGLFALLLPSFSELVGIDFTLQPYISLEMLGLLIAFGLALGALAGAHPALTISSFKPVAALKGKLSITRMKVSPRKVMVTFQFFVSISLLIVAMVMWKQFQLIETRDLGFYKDQTIIVDLGQNDETIRKRQLIKDELLKTGLISGLTFSSHSPGEKPHSLTTLVNFEGEERSAEIWLNIVDTDFLKNYELTLLAGRGFSKTIASDTVGAIMLNESAVRLLGLSGPEEAIGLDFHQWDRSGKVIGVVKDFNFQSLHEAIEPLSFQVWPDQFRKASIKISGSSFQTALAGLSDKWIDLTNEPFNYTFLNDRLNQLYQQDMLFGKIFRLFTILSLAIAALGLIAFSSFMIRLKTKELAIRKVLGATPLKLVWRLLREFSLPVLMALLLAIAPSYLFLNDWLNQFAFRITLVPVYLILPTAIIIALVGACVLFQSTRTVLENPTKSLRNE